MPRNNRISLYRVLALLALSWGVARAAVPRQIAFQGRLADPAGNPKTGTYSMTFNIYTSATGGAACHSETDSVVVNSGMFVVRLGAATGGINAACAFNAPSWIEIQVGTDAAMAPRTQLLAAPYAITAQAVGGAPGSSTTYAAGNGSGNIPVSNNALNTNLNADMVGSKHFDTMAQTNCYNLNGYIYSTAVTG